MTGNPNATLTVVEFGDLQCPACSRAEETAREVRRQYGDRIRFFFRHFPLWRIHTYAEKAAEATECAAVQGKFWQALERFYQGQSDLSEPALVRYASEIGLDPERFRQCLDSGSMAARVNRDADDAQALGLRATPTFFIGNVRIEGPLDVAQFTRLVEQELARVGTAANHTAFQPPGTSRPAPASSTVGSPGIFSLSSPFGGQMPGGNTGCSESEAQQKQAPLIGTPAARTLFEGTPRALFVDVRERKEFLSGRIPGAVNIPATQIGDRKGQLPSDRMIVLYESGRGSSGDICAAGRAAGRALLALGFSEDRVKVYQDGLAGWEKAGLPVER